MREGTACSRTLQFDCCPVSHLPADFLSVTKIYVGDHFVRRTEVQSAELALQRWSHFVGSTVRSENIQSNHKSVGGTFVW